MAIKYAKIYFCKTIQNLPKLIWKYLATLAYWNRSGGKCTIFAKFSIGKPIAIVQIKKSKLACGAKGREIESRQGIGV
jgi:hypothetical protein